MKAKRNRQGVIIGSRGQTGGPLAPPTPRLRPTPLAFRWGDLVAHGIAAAKLDRIAQWAGWYDPDNCDCPQRQNWLNQAGLTTWRAVRRLLRPFRSGSSRHL